ncbi:DUF5317 family protein [Cellulomonas endophytica]|uniref:DUF5317 family protein n=1 Tax=Cellulomonas endophytica TaxID=2494735 RepID=UPI0010128903|nr:DUF5317 family protein [Cellulomonas endophytica]
MLVLVAALLAALSPLVVGRRPAALLAHRWRHAWVVWAALVVQTVVLELPTPAGVAPLVHVLTYVAAVAFLVLNRGLRGALVAAAGAATNGVTIALNGGTLPAAPAAVAAAGLDHDLAFANSSVVADPVLPWLGDVFAWPAPLPLHNTFSVGDVLLVAGVAVAVWSRGSSHASRQGREPLVPPQDAGEGVPALGEAVEHGPDGERVGA